MHRETVEHEGVPGSVGGAGPVLLLARVDGHADAAHPWRRLRWAQTGARGAAQHPQRAVLYRTLGQRQPDRDHIGRALDQREVLVRGRWVLATRERHPADLAGVDEDRPAQQFTGHTDQPVFVRQTVEAFQALDPLVGGEPSIVRFPDE